ncbi:hypothetical protein BJ322DRAFT_1088940 [Thelephora terrestris]|uniref:Uncharacterized protein n=1 Tax=Thelephora terrestris TaxID=56493 RepID=A0A9P6H521_9AGAM|nr:hypothetical protein BJ322DRAFT_1088940 [Thelephora terrestris]
MNSPPEPGSPSPTTPSSGSPPPDELQLPSAGNTQELEDTSRFFASQSKKPSRTGFLRGLKLRKKEDTAASGSGKQERGAPLSATSSWVEGTQRAMKEELVDQALVDHLKRKFGDPFDDSLLKKHA